MRCLCLLIIRVISVSIDPSCILLGALMARETSGSFESKLTTVVVAIGSIKPLVGDG